MMQGELLELLDLRSSLHPNHRMRAAWNLPDDGPRTNSSLVPNNQCRNVHWRGLILLDPVVPEQAGRFPHTSTAGKRRDEQEKDGGFRTRLTERKDQLVPCSLKASRFVPLALAMRITLCQTR